MLEGIRKVLGDENRPALAFTGNPAKILASKGDHRGSKDFISRC